MLRKGRILNALLRRMLSQEKIDALHQQLLILSKSIKVKICTWQKKRRVWMLLQKPTATAQAFIILMKKVLTLKKYHF